MTYKYYILENTFVGMLNNEEQYSTYIDAMIGLMEFIKEDELSEDPVYKDWPKAKWAINGVKNNDEMTIVYSVGVKRVLS